MKKLYLMVALMMATPALANVSLWTLPPGHPDFAPPNTKPVALGAVIEYQAVANVRGLGNTGNNLLRRK